MGHLQGRVIEAAKKREEGERSSSKSSNNSIPKNWGEFLRLDDNKKELFAFLRREAITLETDKQVISTLLEDVVCRQERNKDGLSPCSHEEADTRMMVHVADAAKQYNSVVCLPYTISEFSLGCFWYWQELSTDSCAPYELPQPDLIINPFLNSAHLYPL